MYKTRQIFRVYILSTEKQSLGTTLCFLKKNLSFRHFYSFSTSSRREFFDRKLIGFSREQMYDVVADVKNYRNFVPFCTRSTILISRPGFLKGDLQIGFPPITESYTSNVTLIKPQLVKAICKDGKLFKSLETTWKFSPGLKSNTQTCIIDFYINFEFKSLIHSQIANVFFDKLVSQMEQAFFQEAKRRYGRESVPIHPLNVVKS